jgi:hypothetical protein
VSAALVCGAVLSVWKRDRPVLPGWLHPRMLRQSACLMLAVLSVASLAAGTYNPFIYFRF